MITYPHSEGPSVTGGYVYRGMALPSIFGAYLYGAYASGTVWAATYDGDQVVSNVEVANIANPSSFGENEAGELYICALGSGAIFRFEAVDDGGGAPFAETHSATGLLDDTAGLGPTDGLIEYDVNSPFWSDNAAKRRWIALADPDDPDAPIVARARSYLSTNCANCRVPGGPTAG